AQHPAIGCSASHLIDAFENGSKAGPISQPCDVSGDQSNQGFAWEATLGEVREQREAVLRGSLIEFQPYKVLHYLPHFGALRIPATMIRVGPHDVDQQEALLGRAQP